MILRFFKESCELEPGKVFEVWKCNMLSQSNISSFNYSYFAPFVLFCQHFSDFCVLFEWVSPGGEQGGLVGALFFWLLLGWLFK